MTLIAGYAVLIDGGTENQFLAENAAGEFLFAKDEAEEIARAIGPRARVERVGEWQEPGGNS
jgi:hypothetical protein